MYQRLKNNKNLIRAILIGYLAAFLFVLLSFGISSVQQAPEESQAEAELPEETIAPERHRVYSRPVSSLKEITSDLEEEDEEAFVPAPDKLNLAYFFPDDADISDSIHSYAGEIYTVMNTLNADFFASYFDLTDTTPLQMAQSRGLGADRVMGAYNPEDHAHDKNNPATWTVNRFKNVNVSFYNGDGTRINGYYNAQEIMALASVYAYYHDMEDAEAMEAYCRALFEKAVGAKVSMGNVYYCSGCLNRTVEQESDEAIAMENQQSELENSLGSNSSGYIAVDSRGNVVNQTNQNIQDQIVISPSLATEIATASGNVIIQTDSYQETYTHEYAVANRDLTATKASQTETAASAENEVISDPNGGTAAQENTETVMTEGAAASSVQEQTAAEAQNVPADGAVVSDTTAAVQESSSKSHSIDDQIVVSPAKNPVTQPAAETPAPAPEDTGAISEEPVTIGALMDAGLIFLNVA